MKRLMLILFPKTSKNNSINRPLLWQYYFRVEADVENKNAHNANIDKHCVHIFSRHANTLSIFLLDVQSLASIG